MKKFLATLCLLAIGLNSYAVELFPYQSGVAQRLNGTVVTRGCNDYIIIEPKEESTFWQDLINPQTLMAVATTAVIAVDPYIVPIDGTNYVMVKDNASNDWSEKDLLGIDDPKDNMFLSLRNLESDGNYARISSQELAKANIRLVKLSKDGILLVDDRKQDYPLNKIDYIDMMKLKKTANSKETGIFGHFNVYLNTDSSDKKMVVGYVTFDTHSNLKIMFQ